MGWARTSTQSVLPSRSLSWACSKPRMQQPTASTRGGPWQRPLAPTSAVPPHWARPSRNERPRWLTQRTWRIVTSPSDSPCTRAPASSAGLASSLRPRAPASTSRTRGRAISHSHSYQARFRALRFAGALREKKAIRSRMRSSASTIFCGARAASVCLPAAAIWLTSSAHAASGQLAQRSEARLLRWAMRLASHSCAYRRARQRMGRFSLPLGCSSSPPPLPHCYCSRLLPRGPRLAHTFRLGR